MPTDRTKPSFHPLSQTDLPEILALSRADRARFCDRTVGILYMWARQCDTQYASFSGMHLLRSIWNGRRVYGCPIGEGDFSAALDAVAADAADDGEALVFASLSTEEADRIAAHFGGGERSTDEGWNDYLYSAEALSTFAGRAYHGPRNHVNRFSALYPDYTYDSLTPELIDEVSAFYAVQRIAADDGTESAAAEADAAAEMLLLYPDLLKAGAPLSGGVLRVSGEIVGFSIGEIADDTLYVHIEKGNTAYSGVYPMLVREFARRAPECGVKWINREEDDGNPGLRRSKLAYRPSALLEKTVLTVPRI